MVHIEGKLKRVNRFPPPPEAAAEGVIDLYEAWVFSEHLGTNPYVVALHRMARRTCRENCSAKSPPKIKGPSYFVPPVAIDGYFVKKYRPTTPNDGRNTQREALFIIGPFRSSTLPTLPRRPKPAPGWAPWRRASSLFSGQWSVPL